MSEHKPSARSASGMLILIVGLILYAFTAAAIGDTLIGSPLAIQTIFYTVAGIAWIFPVKKLLRWMDAGHKKG